MFKVNYALFFFTKIYLTKNSKAIGVKIIPRKLPTTELNIATASFPPTLFVKITADETGGGMQLTVVNL